MDFGNPDGNRGWALLSLKKNRKIDA